MRDVFTEVNNTCYHVTFEESGKKTIFTFKFGVYDGFFTKIQDESGVTIPLDSKKAPQIIKSAAKTLQAEIEEEIEQTADFDLNLEEN